MAAAHGTAFFLLCLSASSSWALPQGGFPHNSPSSVRGPAFSNSPPQQYPIIPYSYGYEVQDPLTNNYQNKAEIKTANGDVYGSYSVLMPDGYIYTTTYNSTPATGFVSRLVKTLAILPQQLAAQAKSQQQVQPQQRQLQQSAAATAAKPQHIRLVKSQPQLPQQQLQQAQPQLPQQQFQQPQSQQQPTKLQQVSQFQTQLPQPQQLHPQQQQQQLSQPQQLQQLQHLQLSQSQQVQSPQQQLSQPQQLQQLQHLQLSQSQQVQSPQFLQTQQPFLLPTELRGPFRLAL